MPAPPPTPLASASLWSRLVYASAPSADASDPEVLRAASHTIFIALASCAVGLLSSVVHLSSGEPRRALFTGLFGLALLFPIGLLRATRRPRLAAHTTLVMIAAGLVISPFTADSSIPIMLGLIIVPFAAVAATGLVGGVAWTVICALLLAGAALGPSLSPEERTLAWNAALVCGCLGVAGVWLERQRMAALREAGTARDRAEAEARTRAEAEDLLRDSEMLLSTIFRRTPSMLILSDLATGKILDVNEAFEQISGWSPDEAIGSTLTDLDAWASVEDREQLKQFLTRSEILEYVELRLRTKNGELVDLLASAELIEVDGHPQLLAQGIDVTRRKRAEEQLAIYHQELEDRVERRGAELAASMERLQHQERLVTVGTLAAGIAHQINNPIGAISVISESALVDAQREGLSKEYTQAMERILSEAQRCGRIVKSVLQFARDEPSAKWLEDLHPTVQRAASLVLDYVANRGGRLDVTLHPAPLPILMSPVAVEQILVNLVRNAAESRAAGVSIAIETCVEDDHAVLAIEDNGPGMPPDVRGRVFDPFYTTRLGEGGTGLGLSVAHGLVTDHAGRISAGAAASGGTRIEIRFPLQTTATVLNA